MSLLKRMRMRISRIHIKNFKSLKNVALDDLGDLVVFTGKNSSGKSNILEAIHLFFNCFNVVEPSPVTSIPEFDTYLWYDLDTQNPITTTVEVKFDATESEEIFPIKVLTIIKERFPTAYGHVVLSRSIDEKTGWKTEYVKWADIPLVFDNKLVSPVDFCRSVTASSPEVTTTPPFPESTAAEMIGVIARSLQERIKGKFKLAKVLRDSAERPSNLEMRTTILDSKTYDMLRFLKQSRTHEDEQQWNGIERRFEDTSSMKLDLREGEMFVRIADLCLPLHLIGGGDQETLLLNRFITNHDSIIAIEEPEMHLHPRLIMGIVAFIKTFSADSQVFLATHSPTIIDHVDLPNIYLVRMEGKETQIVGFGQTKELRNMIKQLGIPLSAILFAEKLLVVEGELEKVMLPIFAKKMGIDPYSFSIISITPKLQSDAGSFTFFFRKKPILEYHLRVWKEISRTTGIAVFLLLRPMAKKEVETLVHEGTLSDLDYVILPKAIENLLPVELWVNVVNDNYGTTVAVTDIDPTMPRMTELNRMLLDQKTLPFGWKIHCAEQVAEKTPIEKIPDEIKMLFAHMMLSLPKEQKT